jgi:phosphoglycerate dehydrogenase-like enzyme
LEVWAIARGSIGPRTGRYSVPGTGDPEGTIPARSFGLDELDDVLPQVDYLVLTLPLSPATTSLIDERRLRLMRPSAVLLNPSRGRLVEEAALVRALQERWIAGAALDTHFYYPLPPDHVLWTLPNVVLTPHISGSNGSRHFRSRLWSLFADNLNRFVQGQPLLNELAPADLAAL